MECEKCGRLMPIQENTAEGLCRKCKVDQLQASLAKANKNIDIWRETCQLCERKVEVLQAEVERLKELYRWIPVEERLPESNLQVNICEVSPSITWRSVGRYNTFGMKRWRCQDSVVSPAVTHWKPIILPERKEKDK